MNPPIEELEKVILYYRKKEIEYGIKMDVTIPKLSRILKEFNYIKTNKMKKETVTELPHLYKITNCGESFFAFANTPSKALELIENEITNEEPSTVELVCFANDIVNLNTIS